MKDNEGLRMLRCTVKNSKKQNVSVLFGTGECKNNALPLVVSLLVSILLLTLAQLAQAQPTCPDAPLAVESELAAREALKALGPLMLKEQKDDSPCKPKVNGVLAFGNPVCLLSRSVPVMGVGYSFVQGNEAPIAAYYMVEYSERRHKEIEDLIGVGRIKVEIDALPPKLRRLGVHEELTITYRQGSTLVSLQKPSNGMPGQWLSLVVFEREDYVQLTRRDLNSCN